jgi:hypothetical protein
VGCFHIVLRKQTLRVLDNFTNNEVKTQSPQRTWATYTTARALLPLTLLEPTPLEPGRNFNHSGLVVRPQQHLW